MFHRTARRAWLPLAALLATGLPLAGQEPLTLGQVVTRALAQNSVLFDWLKTLYPIWARRTPEAVYLGAKLGHRPFHRPAIKGRKFILFAFVPKF